jgi:hypothetical protein
MAKPTDHTGRVKEAAAKAAAEEQAAKQAEVTLAAAEAKVKLETEVISMVEPTTASVIVDEVVTIADKREDTVVIRVVEDIENMTYGTGNMYTFKAGQKYEVSRTIANHLKEIGYLANNL